MVWRVLNTIKEPCLCGKGLIISVHIADENGNNRTNWELRCDDCSSKYDIVDNKLVGNNDSLISSIRIVKKSSI